MRLNDAGGVVNNTWYEMPDHYLGIELDVTLIMPNRLHGIIVICEVGTAPRGRPYPGIVSRHRERTGTGICPYGVPFAVGRALITCECDRKSRDVLLCACYNSAFGSMIT
jgi:hypothetical protein